MACLHKHKKDVLKFYNYVMDRNYASEAARQYQKRIQKSKDCLFLFLDYDNVSWNNNNAEKAIKLLATHTNRKIRLFSENRMRDY